MLTDMDKSVLVAFAESGMNKTETAKKAFRSRANIYQCLERVEITTGLDPHNLFDLVQLLELAGVGREDLCPDAQTIIDRQQAKIIKLQNKNSKVRNERNRLKKEIERYKTALMNANKSYRKLWEEMRGAIDG